MGSRTIEDSDKISEKLKNLSPEKKALLLKKLKEQSSKKPEKKTVLKPIPEGATRPLSFAQQRLWFLEQLEGENPRYNEFAGHHISGKLDVPILKESLQAVVDKHDILRTYFPDDNGSPVQVVEKDHQVNLIVEEHSGLNDDEEKKLLELKAGEEATTPFKLSQPKLYRIKLLKFSEESYVLFTTMHHCICDGWSTQIFVKELTEQYISRKSGNKLDISKQKLQYADYAYWQQAESKGKNLDAHKEYWKKQLDGVPPVMDLHFDRQRPSVAGFEGSGVAIDISEETTDALRAIARQNNATLYMVLLSVYKLLLRWYSGRDDIVVGTPVANRDRKELEDMIGFFVNMIVLRTDLTDELSFNELLGKVRNTCQGSFKYKDLPFEQVVEILQPDRDMSYHPVFQVLFAHQQKAEGSNAVSGLEVKPLPALDTSAKFELALMVEEGKDLHCSFEYACDLFDHVTVERIAEHFKQVIEALVADPTQSLANLTCISRDEEAQLELFNNTKVDYDLETCLHTLFEKQVDLTPDASALRFNGTELSYTEFNAKANQLAHYLRKQGVGPEKLVGVCCERSIELVVALYGIMKAGGVYVPLDPEYPADRLRFMMEDAEVPVLLTQEHVYSRLSDELSGHKCPVLNLDTEWDQIAAESEENPECLTDFENSAYMIYTSGSTGKPKGVPNPHKAIVNRLLWKQDEYKLQADDRILQKTPFSFDVSVWEFFWPLINGAQLVVAPPGVHQESAELVKLVQDAEITTMHFVPSMLQYFLSESAVSDCKSLRRVICSGEALPADLEKSFFSRLSCELHNLYGPTEAAVDVTSWQCQPNSELSYVPIGKPIANIGIHILDKNLKNLPVGVAGELHISGVGLAKGYYKREELTAEKFISNPYGESGDRLYKTGDLARFNNEGVIEYCGRIDNQVKIRGLRIELGEIEHALCQYEGIRESLVIVQDYLGGNKRLVAYIVLSDTKAYDESQLRSFLQQQLPDYMVPAVIMCLDAIPLTPNGKADRKALPMPKLDEGAETVQYEEPQTDLERQLADIWLSVLDPDNSQEGKLKIGRKSSFFASGGHSLLATQVVSRIRENLSISVSVRQVFETPVLSDLAKSLESYESDSQSEIKALPDDVDVPLSFSQERLWFINQYEEAGTAYTIPLAVKVSGSLDTSNLQEAFSKLIKRHKTLRTVFPDKNGIPEILVLDEIDCSLTEVDTTALDDSARDKLLQDEVQKPFDLEKGPLFRMTRFLINAEESILLLCLHHIIADGWSIGVLARELTEIYSSLCKGVDSELSDPALQYQDIAAWQREEAEKGKLEKQLDFWKSELAGAPAVIDLPYDRSRSKLKSYKGANIEFKLEPELLNDIQALIKKNESNGSDAPSLFMTLFSGFAALLSRYSLQDECVIGTPIANRNRRETEDIIGCFVNMLAIRCDFSEKPTFANLLKSIQKTMLDAYDRQDVPFEQVVDALQPERNSSYTPLFQVAFGLQNFPFDYNMQLGDAKLSPHNLDSGTSKFDLMILMHEAGDELHGVLEYNTDLFDEHTMQQLIQHYMQLLKHVCENEEESIDRIALLDSSEEKRILNEWSGIKTNYPREKAVHEVFEEVVEANPDSVALSFLGEEITYNELNRRADNIRFNLISKGVNAEHKVGLFTERSADAIAAILGILKTGASYVPLDPSYPNDRLAYIIKDTDIALILKGESLSVDNLNVAATTEFIDISDITEFDGDRAVAELVKSAADSAAYIMYTSGSTGQPKGSVIPHRAIVRLVKETNFVELDESQRFLQYAPISFDASTIEIWGALLNGATLVIMKPGAATLEELGQTLKSEKISTLWLTSSLFSQMVDFQPESLSGLKQLLAGGDVLSVSHVRKAIDLLKDGSVINGYGPTENTTFSCCHTIRAEDCEKEGIPIGKPIANSTAYILDSNLHPVPVGVKGQLYVGGDGLAIGYHNQDELNKERFIPSPFSNDKSDRLYATGDLVRWNSGGTIEFIGRADNQIKIRGFRIEPGEIETALTAIEEVREALVMTTENDSGVKSLTAYITTHSVIEDALIKSKLKEVLPSYMIPQFILSLDEFPLTPNGKVDRKALPLPTNDLADEGIVLPRTETEKSLAAIWSEVLGVDSIGIDQDFFDLGGHSLLATQVLSRVRETFSVEFPLNQIFESSTISSLATAIEEASDKGSGFPSIEVRKDRTDARLSFAQERLWFLYQLEPENPFYNVSVSLQLKGELNVDALERSIQSIVDRHEVLQSSFYERDGVAMQKRAQVSEFSLERVQLDSSDEKAIYDYSQKEGQRPFNLTKDLLIRGVLIEPGSEGTTEHHLVLTMHHIVSDGWSMGLIVQELSQYYNFHTSGEAVNLAECDVQYADFSVWQRELYDNGALHSQMEYWKQQLAGFPPILTLPTDRPRPLQQSFRGGSITFDIEPGVKEKLMTFGREEGATLFMTLISAYAAMLGRCSRQDDLVIGSPIANRNRSDIEPLIGFFVNTLALRIDLSGEPSFREIVRRVREMTMSAYDNQDVPFEKLVDTLQPDRDLSRNPLFQVMFALQNVPLDKLSLNGLELKMLDIERRSAQFDLVLDFWESETDLTGVLEYNTDLFDRATVERFIRYITTILSAVAENPDLDCAQINLLDEDERKWLLDTGTGPIAEYPVTTPIQQLFEKQVERRPDYVSIEYGSASLTYDQLNRQANRLACELRECGVKPNTFVGIVLERGPEFLVSMLAVLKAGGAYIPIDPTYPIERIRHMISDSHPPCVITRHSLSADLTDGESDATLIYIEDGSYKKHSEENIDCVNSSEDIAYMLYTSGSTGAPKGAMVRHDGAINHIYSEFDLLSFHEDSAFLQSAPSSSDISVWQFLAPQLIGGRTVVADFETVCDAGALFDLMKESGITVFELVPAVLSALIEHMQQLPKGEMDLPALECAMVTGEEVSAPLVNRWIELFKEIPLVNAYGPTEAADDICQAYITEAVPLDQSVSIGETIHNMKIYVLDDNLKLSPRGISGEICVSGIGVGPGYWENEELTKDRFVPNPIDYGKHEKLLYRTGDLGRWRNDGSLEFMGRLDEQVKIRGFRIECGEIESVLNQHDDIRESVVVVAEDEAKEKQLVAYVVPAAANESDDSNDIEDGKVDLWKSLHEDSYSDDSLLKIDPYFNTIGWDSTYTGEPLPAEDMHEYVDDTIRRVLATKPKSILEIGCGTGLLMFKLLGSSDVKYTGVDLSQVAIDQLQSMIDSDKFQLRDSTDGIHLTQGAAHKIDKMEDCQCDTIMLPSVVQYFPSTQYLLTVIKKGILALGKKGIIFIGDVRSNSQLKAYHASIQLSKTEDDCRSKTFASAVEQRVEGEQELAIDPLFFHALVGRIDGVTSVSVEPKSGINHNELTCFRYDVFVTVGGSESLTQKSSNWKQWNPDVKIEALSEVLSTEAPELVAFQNISNARCLDEMTILEWIDSASNETIKDLRTRIEKQSNTGLDPAAVEELAERLGYECSMQICSSNSDGMFDLQLRKKGATVEFLSFEVQGDLSKAWADYASNPLHEQLSADIIPKLRQFCKGQLPVHMMPAAYSILQTLPMLPNGKINRKALPPVRMRVHAAGEGGRKPETKFEIALAEIWCEVLDLERITCSENFFELGGHSLKATQVISRIRKQLGLEIALREIFNKPTIEDLAVVLENSGNSQVEEIVRVADAADYPVSNAQRRLWILSQIDAGSRAYNMPAVLNFEGDLDMSAFRKAWTTVVTRHEILRTTFSIIDNTPRQIIHDQMPEMIEGLFCSSDDELSDILQEKALEKFDLESGPLVRLSLIKMSDGSTTLLFNMHHIISDDWSIGVVIKEFVASYKAAIVESAPALPELTTHYRDYTIWHNERLENGDYKNQAEYWHKKLEGPLPVLNLVTDKPRPVEKTYDGDTAYCKIDKETLSEIKEHCQAKNVSLFMFLVTTLKVLLHRYSGEKDIVVGCPVAGRNHAASENQIGFYINTLALRDQLNPEQSFEEFLAQVADTMQNAYDNQDYPFDLLIDELGVDRDVSRNPGFDVMAVMQNVDKDNFELPGINVSAPNIDFGISKFDLQLNFVESEDELEIQIVYSTALFNKARIERMCEHMTVLASSAVNQPNQSLAEINYVSENEYKFLKDEVNDMSADYPDQATIINLFEEQREKNPDAVALIGVGDAADITYAEVDVYANKVANLLIDRGVNTADRVAVFMPRSNQMVITLLGILKAGATYVPLDPEYPKDRTDFMISDSEAKTVLREEDYLAAESFSDKAPERSSDPDTGAYVIYTSGSTGKPKGCMISNRNVVRLMTNSRFDFDFDANDVWVVAHSFCFDFSVWEIYGALLYGGRLVVAERDSVRNTQLFHEFISTHRVTVLNQTPAAFYNLTEIERGCENHTLDEHIRMVIFGGDKLDLNRVKDWVHFYELDKIALINMYGITETTVHVTYGPLTNEDIEHSAHLSPVGRPLPETTVYVCDENMKLQAVGVPGELYVGGTGVSIGYLNREELTAERFIESPFVEGERLYRSGDVGMWREDGSLVHMGRNDGQIQLRGFRIELGEIEQGLSTIAEITRAVVMLRSDIGSEDQLVAYITIEAGKEVPASSEILSKLREFVPEYMLPSHIVSLDKFPLTSNGKIDRKSLPLPTAKTEETSDESVTMTTTEQLLADVWKDILGLSKVGLTDNFFDIGGQSLSIIKVHNKLKEEHSLDVPIVDLFKYPTIQSLSGCVEARENAPQQSRKDEVKDRVKKQQEARKRRRRKK